MNQPMQGWVKTVHLPKPSLSNNTADADRLIDVLKAELHVDHIGMDLDLMQQLPDRVRKADYHLHVILFKDGPHWHLVNIMPGGDACTAAGIAVDLGTSRVVLRLVDLATGKTLGESAVDNPQIAIGPDILTRVHYADSAGGRKRLQQLIVDTINTRIDGLCRRNRLTPTDVHLVTIAGNTTMTHLFMGLAPRHIIREPYIPAVNRPGVHKTKDLGLLAHTNARALIFPNIGSYFGGDLIAGILFSGLHQKTETGLLVDVGTNAEVVVGNGDWLMACAGAAGPALEGGVSQMGMMAGPGAIDRIRIDPDTGQWNLRTIEEKPARGICGSGMIDLAAQLFLTGRLDIRGKLVDSICADRYGVHDGMARLTVVEGAKSATGQPLTIDQADIDSLIRSKAAMYTILETITSHVGLTFADLATFYVAGTFGAFIDPASAIAIGMIPDLPIAKYRSLGNSSLEGATMALTSIDAVDTIDRIRNQITYLELNVNQDFMNRFSAAKFLPHTDRSRFPSVTTIETNL